MLLPLFSLIIIISNLQYLVKLTHSKERKNIIIRRLYFSLVILTGCSLRQCEQPLQRTCW